MKRARILVIDDDPLFRSLIVSLLRRDFHVSVAGEGSDGFYRALEQKPELVIIDSQMPGWDGLKTVRAFRSHAGLDSAKIILLNSGTSKENVLAAIEAGADACIVKTSLSKRDLLRKIEHLLSSVRTRTKALSRECLWNDFPPDELSVTLSEKVPPHAAHEAAVGSFETNELVQEMIDQWE